MQYISRAHTARVSLIFVDDEGTSVMNWPTSSPDLNPLEHTRDILTRCIRQRSHCPENIHNRIDALMQELQAIPQKAIWSMPRRCHELVNDNGGPTT